MKTVISLDGDHKSTKAEFVLTPYFLSARKSQACKIMRLIKDAQGPYLKSDGSRRSAAL